VKLVDSSSWVEALRRSGSAEVRERVRALLVDGQAAWCDMVRLELWNGAAGEAEKKTLRQLERDLVSLDLTAEVWDLACDLARRLRSASLTVPSTDLLIMACARHHRVPLEHCDEHYARMERVLGTV
jgi:predicted nucleic acid-binding protein